MLRTPHRLVAGIGKGQAVMRVVVNQLAALRQKTGIGHHTAELLRCLRRQAGEDEIDAFPTGWLARAWKTCVRARNRLEAGGQRPDSGKQRNSPWRGLRARGAQAMRRAGLRLVAGHLRRSCERRKYDLYHEPNFIPLPSDCPTVATLHDLSVLLHPDWHPADRVAHFEQNFPSVVSRCVHFLTVSEFTRQEVIRTLGLPPERVTRVYNGIRPDLGPLPTEEVTRTLHRLGLPSRYLLHVGTIEPRKNLLLLLRAYCGLPGELRAAWPLLLVGHWGWNTAAAAQFFHQEARHRGVLHLGYVSEEHLVALYNGARALVYPSLYEGFGLPPMEMMACGGAVLASTAAALVETVGGQAHLVEPDDLDGWREAMSRVITDDDWWQFLRSGAESVARPYTWERCAAETLQVYRSLCGGGDGQAVSSTPPTPPVLRAAG